MTTAQNKTQKTTASVSAFLNTIEDPQKKKDAKAILAMMKQITGEKPKMWGPSMVGFGEYHYTYDSGREGDMFITGFSPRKTALTIYIMPGYQDFGSLMNKLGKYKTGKACLYIKKLDDIHLPTLKKLITAGYKDMKKKNKHTTAK